MNSKKIRIINTSLTICWSKLICWSRITIVAWRWILILLRASSTNYRFSNWLNCRNRCHKINWIISRWIKINSKIMVEMILMLGQSSPTNQTSWKETCPIFSICRRLKTRSSRLTPEGLTTSSNHKKQTYFPNKPEWFQNKIKWCRIKWIRCRIRTWQSNKARMKCFNSNWKSTQMIIRQINWISNLSRISIKRWNNKIMIS